MNELPQIPQWFLILVAIIVPGIAIISFWMALSARLTKIEVAAELAAKASLLATEIAAKAALLATEKFSSLSESYIKFREDVAKEYIHRSTMLEFDDRLTKAVDRLADRIDKLLTGVTGK